MYMEILTRTYFIKEVIAIILHRRRRFVNKNNHDKKSKPLHGTKEQGINIMNNMTRYCFSKEASGFILQQGRRFVNRKISAQAKK
jgi:hypothetical protein